jgi:hypothetical protein
MGGARASIPTLVWLYVGIDLNAADENDESGV